MLKFSEHIVLLFGPTTVVSKLNFHFSEMKELDCDESMIMSPLSGELAKRDIVQFVPLRNFEVYARNIRGLHLAKEVLREVPNQVEIWMRANEKAKAKASAEL